jgi:hypothetical protein
MKERNGSTLHLLLIFTLLLGAIALPSSAQEANRGILKGRIVAVGVPGASAISPVGTFLPGGPIHDKPAFSSYTQPGRILDPVRILVGSTSNFGAPPVDAAHREGSFLSIDPRGPDKLVIPSDFASAGNQASALDGAVQMYSAQSPGFLNAVNNPAAITAPLTAVSNPLGISINNAFGRLWPANAPYGLHGIGTSTIVDPTGLPLAGAPNVQAGGVFAGDLTPRLPAQLLPGGLTVGAVGTAFLGRSPDGSGRAVFGVVLADGSLVQEHTAHGVDGLASAGTVAPLIRANFDEEEDHTNPRLGVILNYTPRRILYVSEPFRNSIAVLELADDSQIFHVASAHRIHSDVLNSPVDLAPADIETQNPNWASNTTLEEGADFYVANRGNNTIVRMRQDGSVVAVREVRLDDGQPLGGARLNGIATSPDGTKIWVTVTGSLQGEDCPEGGVIELPTFPE